MICSKFSDDRTEAVCMSVTHIQAVNEVKINFFVGEAIIPAETCYYLMLFWPCIIV